MASRTATRVQETLAELFGDGTGLRGDRVSGVLGGDGFDEGKVGFGGGGGIVAGSAGDDEGVAREDGNGAAVGGRAADGERSGEDEEELVFVGVSVPGEVAEDADDLEEMIVDLADDAREPKVWEGGGAFGEGDRLLHGWEARTGVETGPLGDDNQKCDGKAYPGSGRPARELVAETGGDGDFMTALGAAAVEDGLAGFGLHAGEEAVHFGAVAAVGLKGALGH